MSEWWTYRPSDFLMFSPAIYWRLFESINQAWWPWQVVGGLLAGAGFVALGRHAGEAHVARATLARAMLAGFALTLLVCAWDFHLQRFAPINWPARGYAALFVLLALLVAGLAALGRFTSPRTDLRLHGAALLGCVVVAVYPLLAPASGRPWQAAEAFGLAPDPTVLAMLALLALLRPGDGVSSLLSALAWTIGVAWCVIAALGLWTLGSAQWTVVLAAALFALGLARRG